VVTEQYRVTTGAMGGIGWAVLHLDSTTGPLFNEWISEHDVGYRAGCAPVLVPDVLEHAFTLDYGLKRADYIAAYFKNINWGAAEARLK